MHNSEDVKQLSKKAKELKLLYVEDEPEIRDATTKNLEIFFQDITVVTNGAQALYEFEKQRFDLLITDICMPQINGIELIKKIKEKSDIPTLIISAFTNKEYMIESIKIGVDGFILKPIEHTQFLSSLKKVIDKACMQKENERNLMILNQYKDITNKSSIISKTNPNGIITFVNDNFCEISGYSQDELIGKNHNIVRHPDTPKKVFKELWKTIKVKKESWSGVIKNLSKEGKTYFVKSTIKPLVDQDGEIIEFMALRDDVTEIMSEKKQLLASLDSNNNSFLALIKIENFDILDNFYDSNTVDTIELKFKELLYKLLPHENVFDRVYKLGDGLFAISCSLKNIEVSSLNIQQELKNFIERTKKSTVKLDDIEYDVAVVVSYCYGDKNVFENAKFGIEKALENNINLIFANNLVKEAQDKAKKNIKTIHMVKKALDSCNIVSYFQPIIDNKTQEIVKYESLVRLIDEDENIISPAQFLDISKKGTYYTKITNRVIETSFAILDNITHNVSINLSVLDIENENIRKKINELIENKKYRGRVTFELLEDENIKDIKLVKSFIKNVKSKGNVKIAIDDFGSGYSNFERLLDYNPDILKIDGSLIRNIETNMFSRNIVETIVTFAKKQNIKTIAEFVENENIYKILNNMGIDYSQGYYFGKPERII
ncbi:MAG: EAL domain-containing protein [Campylobacterota bacterium]